MTSPFHPRTAAARRHGDGRLHLRDAVAMAVGGMIGGGIFSVLGVTVALAGHLAVVAFAVGGVIAGMTAHSFAQLSVRAGRSGGLFAYLTDAGFPGLGAYLSWLLLFGYVIAMAVYGFTFGHYAASALGLGELAADSLALVAVGGFLLINLRGVSTSAVVEDVVVAVKLLILALVSGVGLAHFEPARLVPAANVGVGVGIGGVVLAATSIFVAYEGFELLSYDYDDIEQPRRTLPLALLLSVGLVALVYIAVTIGSQMLVSDRVLVDAQEVAFAVAGRAALGAAGVWLATFGALLASSSAINATLFSTARQMREIAAARELPAVLGTVRHGAPVAALVLLALLGAGFAMVPSIESLLTFGSAVFLAVFGVVDLLAFGTATTRTDRGIGLAGAPACFAALAVLLIRLVVADPGTLVLVAICVAAVSGLRIAFVLHRRARRAGADLASAP